MLIKYDTIRGILMKMENVIFHLEMMVTQWHSNWRGFNKKPKSYSQYVHMNRTGTLEMKKWCEENCKSRYYGVQTSCFWLFDNGEDAMAFKLRWL